MDQPSPSGDHRETTIVKIQMSLELVMSECSAPVAVWDSTEVIHHGMKLTIGHYVTDNAKCQCL